MPQFERKRNREENNLQSYNNNSNDVISDKSISNIIIIIIMENNIIQKNDSNHEALFFVYEEYKAPLDKLKCIVFFNEIQTINKKIKPIWNHFIVFSIEEEIKNEISMETQKNIKRIFFTKNKNMKYNGITFHMKR